MFRRMGRIISGLGRWFFYASHARAAVSSFLIVILVGAVLLVLPVSSAEGEWTSPVDALLTSTSAVCVTGLIVKDTPVYWSGFGKAVILCLIQAGGLGIMTLSAFLAITLMRGLSMRFERVMGDIMKAEGEESVWNLIRFIFKFTLVAEVLGTIALFVCWRGNFESFWRCLHFSIFHSISAFCNAGFSLYSDSLVRYRGSVGTNVIVCSLIFFGGIGFIVVRDLKHYLWWKLFVRKGRRASLSTHSKLVLIVSAALLVVGFLGILGMESFAGLQEASWKETVLAAMFQSVTPRTAGFNTMPLSPSGAGGSFAPAGVATATALLLIALMFIGGSPGSTAGGIKTSTLGVVIASIAATLKGRSRSEILHHSVRSPTVHRVASIILLSLTALVAAIFLLSVTERAAITNGKTTFLALAFEATSAFGTVGLSLGITPELTSLGKLIITALMFVGRLGPITLLMSVARMEDKASYSYPGAFIMVG